MTPTTASLATGAPMTADTWADFVRRLRHDCIGEGVEDHSTADAIFIVQARRKIFGIDKDYTDQWAVILDDMSWFSPQEYWDDCDEEEQASLDAAAAEESDGESKFLDLSQSDQWELLGDLPDHTVTGWYERWEYVCAHLTKDAADSFITRKKHDFPDGLRVYVEAQTYCWEFNEIKDAIMRGQLVFQPETKD